MRSTCFLRYQSVPWLESAERVYAKLTDQRWSWYVLVSASSQTFKCRSQAVMNKLNATQNFQKSLRNWCLRLLSNSLCKCFRGASVTLRQSTRYFGPNCVRKTTSSSPCTKRIRNAFWLRLKLHRSLMPRKDRRNIEWGRIEACQNERALVRR